MLFKLAYSFIILSYTESKLLLFLKVLFNKVFTCFFFYKQSKFRKRALAYLRKKLVQGQSMLALCLFIKILLGACLWKRLDQARNMVRVEKLLYKMCCCYDADYNIIGHLASIERYLFCCIFDESEEKCFAILNRKNHSQYGKNSCYQEKCLT